MTHTRAALLARAAALVGGQRTLATMIAVSERNMRYWLSGNHEPNNGVMADVAAVLEKHAAACCDLRDDINRTP